MFIKKYCVKPYQVKHIQLLLCLTLLFVFSSLSQNLYGQGESVSAPSSEGIQLPHTNQYFEQENTFVGSKDTTAMETMANGPIRKLGRGFSNIVFGIAEVFIQPYKVNQAEGGIAACSYGIFKGLFYFVGRVVVGAVEIVTFPMPLPGASASKYSSSIWGYGPLIEPEWIFTIEDNPYNFIYQDYPVN